MHTPAHEHAIAELFYRHIYVVLMGYELILTLNVLDDDISKWCLGVNA